MQDVLGEPVDPSWLEPLWTDERIGRLLPTWPIHFRSIVHSTVKEIRDEYERDRARLVAQVEALEAQLAKAQEDKTFWEQYGQTRMMDLVEARAEIERLKDGEQDRNARAFVAEVKLGRIRWESE